jgi:hypothetical protein
MPEKNLPEISVEEWHNYLDNIEENEPEGRTRMEIQDALGLSKTSALKFIRKLLSKERLRFEGYATRTNIVGEKCRKPVYNLIGKNEDDQRRVNK